MIFSAWEWIASQSLRGKIRWEIKGEEKGTGGDAVHGGRSRVGGMSVRRRHLLNIGAI